MNNNATKIISVDFSSPFGFLKKNDINEDIYLTYNCLHKPALLGILGAIIGLKGYYQAYIEDKNKLPEYFDMLRDIKVGIEPINSFNGNFQKTVIVYNNSVGYASKETGGNLIVKEQTLIAPGYRVYLMIDDSKKYQQQIYRSLKEKESVFIPYLGKNDFQICWGNFMEYEINSTKPVHDFSISTIFLKEGIVKDSIKKENLISPLKTAKSPLFIYFEQLPVGFSDITKNYELKEFVYTNAVFSPDFILNNLYEIEDYEQNVKLIQMF
jgi:CRISPR-associated protein Cas5h